MVKPDCIVGDSHVVIVRKCVSGLKLGKNVYAMCLAYYISDMCVNISPETQS